MRVSADQIRARLGDGLSVGMFEGWLAYLHTQDEAALGAMVRRYAREAPEQVRWDCPALFAQFRQMLALSARVPAAAFAAASPADIRKMRFWRGFGVAVEAVYCLDRALCGAQRRDDPPFLPWTEGACALPLSPAAAAAVPDETERGYGAELCSDLMGCYFDSGLISREPGGCFVDGGALDLFTAHRYAGLCADRYRAIYAFEPDEAAYRACVQNSILFDSRLHLARAALWDSAGDVSFDCAGENSRCTRAGAASVPGDTLDHLLDGEEPTLIKLHLEGAEARALRGAAETIRRCHPQLAVAIGHRGDDILRIPEEILSIDENYRFYLRHYSAGITESVLYAL